MKRNVWQLQEAKARLSEIVRLSLERGPQILSIHGSEKAVLLSKEEYDHLIAPKENFVEFMNKSPLKGVEIEVERDVSLGRKVKL